MIVAMKFMTHVLCALHLSHMIDADDVLVLDSSRSDVCCCLQIIRLGVLVFQLGSLFIIRLFNTLSCPRLFLCFSISPII